MLTELKAILKPVTTAAVFDAPEIICIAASLVVVPNPATVPITDTPLADDELTFCNNTLPLQVVDEVASAGEVPCICPKAVLIAEVAEPDMPVKVAVE